MYVIVISAANSMKLHAIFSLVMYFAMTYDSTVTHREFMI